MKEHASIFREHWRKLNRSREQRTIKREQEKMKREQGWKNIREQGAMGENVKGAWSPLTEPQKYNKAGW